MRIYFEEFMHKARQVTGCASQIALAKLLDVNRSAVTQAKTRDVVPEKWLLILARKFALPPDWFEGDYGNTLENYRHTRKVFDHEETTSKIVQVPKVSAVLCAGGGSLEVEGAVIEHIPLPYILARSLGVPERLVFMDVTGDSMEPGIYHGDTILIDQSAHDFSPSSIMAVGHGDAIYIKKIKKDSKGGITLISDNPAYSPLYLSGDELDSFRIFGKAVYLFRDLR